MPTVGSLGMTGAGKATMGEVGGRHERSKAASKLPHSKVNARNVQRTKAARRAPVERQDQLIVRTWGPAVLDPYKGGRRGGVRPACGGQAARPPLPSREMMHVSGYVREAAREHPARPSVRERRQF